MKEPIRIISDVHFGHPRSFVQTPSQLAPLLEGVGTLIFNGDSVEMRFRGERALGLGRAEELRAFCRKAGVEPLLLNGNHDPTVSDLNHLELQGGRVLIMHGDALFADISPWSPRARVLGRAVERELAPCGPNPAMEERLAAAKRAVSALEMLKPSATRNGLGRLLGIGRELWPPRRPWLILKTWVETSRRAVTFASEHRPSAERVIIGHVHAPMIRRSKSRLMINTGCFLPPLWRYCVDLAGSELTVRRVRRLQGNVFAPDPRATFRG